MGATVARGALCGCHREERKHQALGAGKEVKVPQKHTLSKIPFLPFSSEKSKEPNTSVDLRE